MSGMLAMGIILLVLDLALISFSNLVNSKLNTQKQTESLENTLWAVLEGQEPVGRSVILTN